MSTTTEQNGGNGTGAADIVEPGVGAADVALGQSILDKVKQKRDERIDDESLVLSIPSWKDELKARYKVVDRGELEKMIRRLRSGDGKATEADLDFLIKSCVEVIAYDADEDKEAPVSEGFTAELAAKLGDPEGTETARGLLLYLTKQPDGKNNTIAIGALALKVARWMQDPSRKPAGDEDPQ